MNKEYVSSKLKESRGYCSSVWEEGNFYKVFVTFKDFSTLKDLISISEMFPIVGDLEIVPSYDDLTIIFLVAK